MELNAENCKTHQGERPLLRIMSEGFCALIDGDIQERLVKAGCSIVSERESDNLGTWAGPMREVIYTTPDQRTMHMYVIATTAIDSWQEEWITSFEPLSWDAAGDLIRQGRRLAFPLSYPPAGDQEGE